MCAWRSASARRKRVRRWMTSIWWVTHWEMNWSIGSVRGTPSTSASMLAEKLVWSSVCLNRLLSTTRATASRLRTITRRWPVRELVSSRTSEMPWTRPVGLLDALATDDEGAVGEVRALDPLDQGVLELLLGRVGVLERPRGALGDLAQVVWRDVGRHADRDAGRAVDKKVGEARGEDGRLLRATVVVGAEVDGVLVDVPHHLHGQRRHPALGVPHRGGRVVARRAEVALAVDERRAQHPRLREADHGVVDRGVAVGVVLTHHVTDDARALREAAVGAVAAVVHRVEDPAVHRLQPVAYVGQRAADDDGHRVVDVGLLHERLQLDRLDAVVAEAEAAGSGTGGGLSHDASFSCVLSM